MSELKLGFEMKKIRLPLGDILPVRQIGGQQRIDRYPTIVKSIKQVGMVEPLMVHPQKGASGKYLLVDGHLRLHALRELGETEADCIIANDDESYTYNARISRMAPIQEHKMILRAVQQGKVKPERIAAALNVPLSHVQTSLEKIKWQNDGTVIQFSAYSEFTLAHMATEILRENPEGTCTLVAENDCGPLDDVLIAADQASLGAHSTSLARPIPQLLLLALRLCWKPLNPLHLLEFLTHPDTPVEFHLRNELSRALVECPGIGGPKWLAAIEGVKEIYKTKPAEEAKRLLPRLENDLAEWIDVAKYEARLGSPGSELANRCQRIAKWARKQYIREQEQDDFAKASLFQCLAAQAAELCAALKETDKVTQCQLERLIKRVSGSGWSSPKIRELGHCHRISSPAACVECADMVFWWNFSDPQTPALPHWTISELEELQRHGAEIPSAASILAVESAQWLRPIWAARKKLMFFTPRQRNGEPVVSHPLLSRIQAVVEGKFPRTDLDMALQRKRIACADKIGHAALPTARRWWKLKDGKHFGIRAAESYSSAEKFIYSPYAWVLDYKAVLRPGVLSQFRMRSENVLRGNLLHRLLDLLGDGPIKKSNWATIAEGELKEYLEKQWPALLEQEGATLLLLGKQSEATALLDTGKQALWTLAQQLRAAQIKETATNVNFKADFIGGQLEGFVDPEPSYLQ